MKLLKKTAIASVLVLGAMGMNAASAITLDSLPGLTSPSVDVSIDNGVATLFGQVDSGIESRLAEKQAAKIPGVNRVINHITFNSK